MHPRPSLEVVGDRTEILSRTTYVGFRIDGSGEHRPIVHRPESETAEAPLAHVRPLPGVELDPASVEVRNAMNEAFNRRRVE